MDEAKRFNDIRQVTYRNRLNIGFFRDKTNWENAPAFLDKNRLIINNHPVMEDWEDNYMKALAEVACSKRGVVMEVGFGMGISAEYIQSHKIREHIVIEANKSVFEKLQDFKMNSIKPVRPIFGFWQDVTKNIPDNSLSGILFDTYPMSKKEIHSNHYEFFPEAFRLLKPSGVFTYYSDEIRNFSHEHRNKLELPGFKKIDKRICQVNPPKECRYWKSNTIVIPIIIK